MPTKSSTKKITEGHVKYAVRKNKPVRTNERALIDSLTALRTSVAELTAHVASINQRLASIETRTQPLPTAAMHTTEAEGWLKLAERSFAFWDNEADAIYDHL
jgi:hypothetical protein